MKCLLISSENAEVLFYWTDAEFQQRVQEQYGSAREDGENSTEARAGIDHPVPAFEDSINTLFAPIIISCITLVDRLGDSYTSFTTEDTHTYVLHQFEECLYIAVNGDGEEDEDDLRRKIYVMKKLTDVLFGMVTLSSDLLKKELRPQDSEHRRSLWRHLQGLLENYTRLRQQDQSFLVEAVERLIHPTLCEQCIEFLERRLVAQLNSSTERMGEEVQHAFILVHTKLLAFYSSRNASTLNSSDLLTLMGMVLHMHPSSPDLEESSPEDVVHHDTTTGSEMFYTPEASPTRHKTEVEDDISSSRLEPSDSSPDSPPMFQFVDPDDIQMAEDSLQALQQAAGGGGGSRPPDPCQPIRVFLESTLKEGVYPMMPHSMYTLPLWPGITLVLLTKIPNGHVAMSIYHFLEMVAKLEKRLREGPDGAWLSRGHTPIQELRGKMDKFIRSLGGGTTHIQTAQLQRVNE